MTQSPTVRLPSLRRSDAETKKARCRKLQEGVRTSLLALSSYISQAGLERLLLLSQGYLSRIKARDGEPSAQLAILLDLIATADPPAFLVDIARRQGISIKLKR